MASCDTFVALPPVTKNGCVVFGKNADRPKWEVQEVVYFEAKSYEANANVEVSLCYSVRLLKRPNKVFV